MAKILRVEKLSKYFGELVAVDDISFELEQGLIYLLIGPNGCGKSTLINCISGFYEPDRGDVYYNNEKITGNPVYSTAQKGLVRTFQIASPFLKLTTLENLLAAYPNNPGENILQSIFFSNWSESEKAAAVKASEIIDILDLTRVWNIPARNLSGGQLKLLEIGRSLMCGANLLLLDEPTGGVNPGLSKHIFEHILNLRETLGLTFFIIEHRLEVAAKYVDHVLAMDRGALVAEGTPKEVFEHPRVIASYLGDKFEKNN
jgi:branched-chain amino acid transport system ATP-binding protein